MSVNDTTTTTDTAEAEYLAAVEEGKAIIADVSGKQWALGDLALKVEKKYGENRLERFAEDINFPGAACTLERYRSVCLAFPQNRGRPRFFGSAQILQGLPALDRVCIVRKNPNIGKAEARELMRAWRAEHPDDNNHGDDKHDDDNELDEGEEAEGTSGANTSTPASAKGVKVRGTKQPVGDEEARLKEVKRVFNIVVDLANNAIDAADDVMKEEQTDLLKVVEPRLVEEVRTGGKKLIALADRLDEALGKAAEAEIGKGRVRKSPKSAPAPVQAQA